MNSLQYDYLVIDMLGGEKSSAITQLKFVRITHSY